MIGPKQNMPASAQTKKPRANITTGGLQNSEPAGGALGATPHTGWMVGGPLPQGRLARLSVYDIEGVE